MHPIHYAVSSTRNSCHKLQASCRHLDDLPNIVTPLALPRFHDDTELYPEHLVVN